MIHITHQLGIAAGVAVFLVAGAADAQESLLPNASFSEGLLAPAGYGYNVAPGSQITWMQAGEGQYAVDLLGAGADWAGLTSRQAAVVAGDTLTIVAWARALPERPPTGADSLYVRFFDHGVFVGQQGPSFEGLGEEWAAVVGVVTVPQGANAADASVQIRSAGGVRIGGMALFVGDALQQAADLLAGPPTGDAWAPVAVPNLGAAADTDGDGLADSLEEALGITGQGIVSRRLTRRKTTSFQTPGPYRTDNDLKVDTVIIAGNDEGSIQSWASMGYEPHVMVGFRAGPEYVDEHPDEVQTTATGIGLTCGPGSYYMVPTQNRRDIFRQYFADAVARGARAACPEEPEFFGQAGYSDSFKREWADFYGEPWRDPISSVQARWMSERLKAHLEVQLMLDCYAGADSASPNTPRFLLAHSPVNYTAWAVAFSHYALLTEGAIDAMVAQVWTGTAQSPTPYEGVSSARTFENAYLEYASSLGLTQGLDTTLWFLMDPLEDNPDRTMDEYHLNYERTLVAALMFPEVEHFETMPWPTRIFGRVPDGYATEISSVIQVLSDMQNAEDYSFDAGPTGVGTFLSDSAMWQRAAPNASDMGSFYGLTYPLLMRGLPVAVPCLDRIIDDGYLDAYRLLFVSYDMLKPLSPEINQALAQWTEDGGCLVVLGGQDAYNQVEEWWHEAGHASPQDHLLARCGFDVTTRTELGGGDRAWAEVARTDYTGQLMENRCVEEIDLTPYLTEGAVLVRCEDSVQSDGWGAYISRLWTSGVRDGESARDEAWSQTDEEFALIAHDDQTGAAGISPGMPLGVDAYPTPPAGAGARFCDGTRSVTYRIEFDPGTEAKLWIDVGNQYRILAAPASAVAPREFARAGGLEIDWTLAPDVPLTLYDAVGANVLAQSADGALVQERALGDGAVIQVGLPPAWFSASAEGASAMRALTHYALREHVGAEWNEQSHIVVRRGPYVIARSLGEPLRLDGRFVNVLQPDLPIEESHALEPDDVAVLLNASGMMQGDPKVLFSSSCIEWSEEQPTRTRLIVSGAEGVTGTLRLYSGDLQAASVVGLAARGGEVAVEVVAEDDSLLLRYPNEPLGLSLVIDWEE